MFAGSPLSASSPSTVPPPSRGLDTPSSVAWSAAQTLAPAELELFQHYLEHTARDPSVVDDDQYTLQVGIPTLACQSKPLMRSVLALAAVCKCSDIIKQSSGSPQDREEVIDLLSLAHSYHVESLREIQATLYEAKNYDHILTNAAMMGMYGSGSHCARIWLVKTAAIDDPPLGDLIPEYPQWMSLFRAARLAYAGLLNNSNTPATMPSPAHLPPDASQFTSEYKASSSKAEKRPRSPTDHPLGPILAATIGPAMAKLHEQAAEILATNDASNPDLQACSAVLAILDTIVAETFPDSNTPQPSSPFPPATGHAVNPDGAGAALEPGEGPARLSQLPLSPWLRRYTASITSMIPSRLPRRTIMAFVHKAPTAYLTLIEDILQTQLIHSHSQTQPQPPTPSQPHPCQCPLQVHVHTPNGTEQTWSQTGTPSHDGTDTCTWPQTPTPSPYPDPTQIDGHPTPCPDYNPDHNPMHNIPPNDLQPELTPAHNLALEIFAHWLVLVMLLDNVWWIGGIGAWELGRVVALRREGLLRRRPGHGWGRWSSAPGQAGLGLGSSCCSSCLGNVQVNMELGGEWWPEGMWEVARVFERFRAR
jgi:hypothetical protein